LSDRSTPSLKPKPAKEPVCFQHFFADPKKTKSFKDRVKQNDNVGKTSQPLKT